MSSSNRGASSYHGARRWLSAWLPVVFAVGVIALESTEMMGADRTTGPLRGIWEFIFGHLTDERWEFTHHLIRKSGHFVGYGLIGLAWLRAWWMSRPRAPFFQNALLALLGTALVASSDEFHQSFLPNRTGTYRDVLLDCAGALVLMSTTYVILRIGAPKRLARAA
jgi:VanZ family protein